MKNTYNLIIISLSHNIQWCIFSFFWHQKAYKKVLFSKNFPLHGLRGCGLAPPKPPPQSVGHHKIRGKTWFSLQRGGGKGWFRCNIYTPVEIIHLNFLRSQGYIYLPPFGLIWKTGKNLMKDFKKRGREKRERKEKRKKGEEGKKIRRFKSIWPFKAQMNLKKSAKTGKNFNTWEEGWGKILLAGPWSEIYNPILIDGC